MSRNDLVVAIPFNFTEYEVSSARRKHQIRKDLLRTSFAIALDLARTKGRRPSALYGDAELLTLEQAGIERDASVDLMLEHGEVKVFQQRYLTAELSREERADVGGN